MEFIFQSELKSWNILLLKTFKSALFSNFTMYLMAKGLLLRQSKPTTIRLHLKLIESSS